VDETGSGLCPMVDFLISGVDPSNSAATHDEGKMIMSSDLLLLCFEVIKLWFRLIWNIIPCLHFCVMSFACK
jgi:hypothetical protein